MSRRKQAKPRAIVSVGTKSQDHDAEQKVELHDLETRNEVETQGEDGVSAMSKNFIEMFEDRSLDKKGPPNRPFSPAQSTDSLGSMQSLSWNSDTGDDDRSSLSPSSCATPNSETTDGNDPELSFTIGPTESTPYACQFCDKAFPRLSYLKRHEQSHSDQMPFKCDFCQRLFKHKRSRDRHVKLHTGDKKYRCPHCEAAFSRSDHLKIHMKTHDHQKPYQCVICNRGYNTAAALTSHMQNHKKESLNSSPSPGSFRCLQCNGTFPTGEELQCHVATQHQPESPIISERKNDNTSSSIKSERSSPKTPTSSQSINLVRSSEGVPPPDHTSSMSPSSRLMLPFGLPKITCIYCSKDTFSSMEALQLHVQALHGPLLNGGINGNPHQLPSHPGDAALCLFPCHFCTMKFPSLMSLHEHALSVHSLSSYIQAKSKENVFCAQCALAFPNSIAYAEHFMLLHTNQISPRKPPDPDNSPESPQTKPTDLSKKRKSNGRSSPTSSTAGRSSGKKQKKEHCTESDYRSSIPPATAAAVSASASQPNLLCNQCSAGFLDFESFRAHLKSHLDDTAHKFVCEECNSEFTSEDQLENHSLAHFLSTSMEYGCQSCLKFFNKPDELQKHLMDIHAHHLYRCALCKDMFDSKVSIQVHFAVKHSNECKLFRCTTCTTVFRSEIEFQMHVRINHLRKLAPYRCLLCPLSFSSEMDLHFHLSTHQKQFTCHICDESFHVEFLLDRHMENHHLVNGGLGRSKTSTGEKTPSKKSYTSSSSGALKCDICDMYLGSELELSIHRKQVHSINAGHKRNVSPNSGTTASETNGPDGKGMPISKSSATLTHSSSSSSLSPLSSLVPNAKPNNCSMTNSDGANGESCGNHKGGGGLGGEAQTVSLNCAYCSEICKNRGELEAHMKNHVTSSSSKHKCNICDEICPTVTLLAEHKLTHCKVISGSMCSTCRINVTSEEEYYSHMKQHSCPLPASNGSGPPGACVTTCSSTTSKTINLTPNESVASRLGGGSAASSISFPVPCIVCRQTLMSSIESQIHARFHTKNYRNEDFLSSSVQLCCLCLRPKCNNNNHNCGLNVPFICEDCVQLKTVVNDQTTSSKSTRAHSVTPTTSPPESKSYQCIKCQSSFSSEEQVQSHVTMHLQKEGSAHECYLCNKQTFFDTPMRLQAHLIEHNFEGYSSLSCYMCSAVFTTAVGLQQHMVSEHGLQSRPYDCSYCHLKFFFRSELENHSYSHERMKKASIIEKPTACNEVSSVVGQVTTVRNKRKKQKKFFYRSDSEESGDEEQERRDDCPNQSYSSAEVMSDGGVQNYSVERDEEELSNRITCFREDANETG